MIHQWRSRTFARRIVRAVAAAACALAAPAAIHADPPPTAPDVLVLAVDGLGVSSGRGFEAIAARARTFDRAYLPHAVAATSRAALFLGRRPDRNGVWTATDGRPANAVLLQERFSRAGYRTVRVGRATGGVLDKVAPWDEAVTPERGADSVQRIIDVLGTAPSQPVFLTASFDDIGPAVEPKNVPGPLLGRRPAIALADQERQSRPGRRAAVRAVAEPARRRAASQHDRRMARLDAELLRLAAFLDHEDRWKHTIVVLVGTQAPRLGENGALPRPDLLFEESLHVPLLIAAPAVSEPGSTHALAQVTDLYPTLLDLAGAAPEADADRDGRSLLPILKDPAASVREAVASVALRQTGHLGRSVRTARWRYNEWPDGSQELYDHRHDRYEATNLALDPSSTPTIARMKAIIGARAKEYQANQAAAVPSPPPSPATRPRPNVLFIVFDDLAMPLGTYGYPVKTPNIDRLARLGRRFDHAYAQVAQCSPSRTSLLSGWQPERTDVWNNRTPVRRPGMIPLQEYFASNGYFTANIGKVWDVRYEAEGSFHWDIFQYMLPPAATPTGDGNSEPAEDDETEALRARRAANLPDWWIATHNRDAQEPDGWRARRAAQILGEKRDRPLFLALGFAKPHRRWIAPQRYFDLYDPAKIELAPSPPDDLTDVPAAALRQGFDRPGAMVGTDAESGLLMPDPELRRQALAAYYATVTFVDAQLGVVLSALDKGHRWDDTIVVLLGDHGYHLGDHGGLWRKDTLFEEAVHAPLIIAGPGIERRGVPSAAPVEFLDVYPTVVEMAGLTPIPGLDGRSLVPMLRDPAAAVRTAAMSWRPIHHPPVVAVSVTDGPFRYTQWPDGSEELFDLTADPHERRNLTTRPEGAAALRELRARRVEMAP